MNIVAIVQCRMGSARFPGKVMQKANDEHLIGLLLKRLSRSKTISKIVVATTNEIEDDILSEFVRSLGFDVYRGSKDDVLKRYYFAAKESKADIVVRITGDCPIIDPEIVDKVVEKYLSDGADYCSAMNFPDGLDTEVFSFSVLEKSYKEASTNHQKEHVTPYMKTMSCFKRDYVWADADYSQIRWTVDEKEDLEVIENVVKYFYPRKDFSWQEVLNLYNTNPNMFTANKHIQRDEGARMTTGQKLWRRAKKVIPGGNMLLSKRAEMFLPEKWPAYFSRAKGCRVWDLDGNEYIDVSIMGIGTNVLGYGHPEVDAVVKEVIEKGNMSSLNCPEEVYLAERLVELHPWASMVKLARTGGEACAVAVRIARAAAGKYKVAFCGYHGWHDWYLAANLTESSNLNSHLLPGLEPKGVPSELKGTIFPFSYNDYHALEQLVTQHEDIGVIVMEVSRSYPPKENFLENVRSLATRKGIVLIFDECTSGFRQSFGGLHKTYGVEPDMATFGKALGNGYAITAVVGRKEVMESAQDTFISSTFWTERIGPTAALKTLQVMEKIKSWEIITQTGLSIIERWEQLANKYSLKIDVWGIPALCGFTIKSENSLVYKTLITQEMLKKGYLASNSIYVCIDHTKDILEGYFENLEYVFSLIKECEDGRDVNTLLEGPICHSGFKRLN